MDSLSKKEQCVYKEFILQKILRDCKELNLSFNIKSAAIYFWLQNPDLFYKDCISLAIKVNDQAMNLTANDIYLAERMNFEFKVPSPYIKMYGVYLILQEKNVQVDWNRAVSNLERLLVYFDLTTVNELVVVALDVPGSVLVDLVDYKEEMVSYLKEKLNEEAVVEQEVLEKIICKLNSTINK